MVMRFLIWLFEIPFRLQFYGERDEKDGAEVNWHTFMPEIMGKIFKLCTNYTEGK